MLRSRSVFQPVLEWSRNPRIQMDRTLAVLGEYGVTEATIRMHCQPPQANIIWGETEKATLVYLITGYHPLIPVLPQSKRLVPVLALKEMSKLNYHQLNALLYLYSKGLRGDALRQWRDDRGTNNFSYLHYVALKELINYSGLTSSAAMEKIQGLSADAAEDLQLSARRALV